MLKKQLSEILELIRSGIINSGNLLQSQFPIFCKQILKFDFVWNMFEAILILLFLIIFIPLAIKGCGHLDKWYGANQIWFCMILFILPILKFFSNVFQILQIKIAPSLYLVNYFRHFIGTLDEHIKTKEGKRE